jgi:hypothetical protein
MYYIVYEIKNLLNGKIYVGVHKTKNIDDGYMGSGLLLRAAIKKYGIENFEKKNIACLTNSKDMYDMEAEIVSEEFVAMDSTYNIQKGGDGGWSHITHLRDQINKNLWDNPEYVKKIKSTSKKFMIEQWKDPVYRKKMIASFIGRKHTDETKRVIGMKNSIHQTGEKNSQFGTCWIFNTSLRESKKIPKNEIDIWLKRGWLKGRKIKF